MKKRYKISHPDSYSTLTVEIDFSYKIDVGEGEIYLVEDDIKEMVDFWITKEERLMDSDGDYTIAFLKQLHAEVMEISIEYNYNLWGIIEEFNDREGWSKMDGSRGIKLIHFEEPEIFDAHLFNVEELK